MIRTEFLRHILLVITNMGPSMKNSFRGRNKWNRVWGAYSQIVISCNESITLKSGRGA